MSSINNYAPSGQSNLRPEVKTAWLKALRGNRRQARSRLKSIRDDGRTGYCCLGVLCDLGTERSTKWKLNYYNEWSYDGEEAYPPEYILERSGLSKIDSETLAKMNDAGIGFKRIANWIERHL